MIGHTNRQTNRDYYFIYIYGYCKGFPFINCFFEFDILIKKRDIDVLDKGLFLLYCSRNSNKTFDLENNYK